MDDPVGSHKLYLKELVFGRVYCKYHYLEGHEFDNPEVELSHFLKKLQDPSWEWSDQYDSELDAFLDTPDEERKCCEFCNS